MKMLFGDMCGYLTTSGCNFGKHFWGIYIFIYILIKSCTHIEITFVYDIK